MILDTLNELDTLVSDHGVSIVRVLQKAIQLAEIEGNQDYKKLFEVHLTGQSVDETTKLVNDNLWVYRAFFKDRLKSDNKMSLTGSAASLERSVQLLERDIEDAREEVRRAKSTQPPIPTVLSAVPIRVANTILQGHKNNFDSSSEIVSRIRRRVNEFVRSVQRERQLLGVGKIETSNMKVITKKVFVVHGHDDAAKFAVARFLEKLGLEPIILHEQPNRGCTIVEKFEQHADVGFAVVVLTPDDYGNSKDKPNEPNPRARQNVIFELGFFFAKLKRVNVCALIKHGVERPSDIDGVVYIDMDASDGWKLGLGRELLAAGFDIDLNHSV